MITTCDGTPSIFGYQMSQLLYRGTKTEVYQGIRVLDAKPVVIKLLRQEYPTSIELLQFRNQYIIAQKLEHPGIVRPLCLEAYRNSYVLVMEDFGGISLKEYLKTNKLELKEFLEIALQICSILHYLYHHHVIHKDIKPANILIHPQTKQIKLTDFSIASLLPRETQCIISPNILEGTLAYISPEQTGRMNRGIDYRSDFYSLGVTFFELLTGQLPFQSNEPMDLVHCHIAKKPPLLEDTSEEIPPVLSNIVMKLMAKNAEERYQSALGLNHDLEKCLTQLTATSKIIDFEIGKNDICDRFMIPEKLYGRETIVQQLLEAFERVAGNSEQNPVTDAHTPHSEMMLVAGFSGIGKTSVVNEVHKPIIRQRGYFIKGKFDQFNRNIPLSAFVESLRDLIIQLLTESEGQLQQWKLKILAALGNNSQVIIDVIPELEQIIGQQPASPEVTGDAAQNRFNLLLQNFIQIFTIKEHPLVIFLDDLQWADLTSLKLIKLLMGELHTGYLLLIGAYRDNEVSPVHPLISTLADIKKTGAIMNSITLQPLSQLKVNQLVSDTLGCEEKLAFPLSQLVSQKTQGNPFFAIQFLKALHQDGLIIFNVEECCWQCDIAKINQQALTDDVVKFMVFQLLRLPESTQQVLKLAACIGNQFDLNTLAIAAQQSPMETAACLWNGLHEGLILPQSEVYKFYVGTEHIPTQDTSHHIVYKFLHDRVQQAAYLLIPDDQKQLTHYKIGTLLLCNSSDAEREERLFEIVTHLNAARTLITQPSELEELTQLNLIAGRKAKSATAYAAAVEYFATGIALLPHDAWESHYNLTLSLHIEVTEATYLNTDFKQMEQWATIVLQHTQTLLDSIPVYVTRMMAAKSQGHPLTTLRIGLQVLQLLGIEFPPQPTPADITRAGEVTMRLWRGNSPLNLLNSPSMIDAHYLASMTIMTNMVSSAYLTTPALMFLLIFKQVEFSILYGNCAVSVYGYADYGVILSSQMESLEAGYEFGQLALNLLQKLESKTLQCRTYFIVYSFIFHWKETLHEQLPHLLTGYHSGLETGDIESTALNAQAYCHYAYFAGRELTGLATEMSAYAQSIRSLRQETTLHYLEIAYQAVENLLGENQFPERLTGNIYHAEQKLPVHQANQDITGLFHWHFYQTILWYLFGYYRQAAQQSRLVEQYLDGGISQFSIPVYVFYDSLIHLSLYKEANQEEQQQILTRVAANQAKMQSWADVCKYNHQHRWELVEAERYAILGDKIEAIALYDLAISRAKANAFLQDEALANELAAKFYLNWDKEKVAQIYLQEAYYCYARWGAKAKTDDLEKHYPRLLQPILQQRQLNLDTLETIVDTTITNYSSHLLDSSSSSTVFFTLDFAAILKASQVLSSEIHLDKLITALMQVLLQNSGAQKIALILPEETHCIVVAVSNLEDLATGKTIELTSTPLDISHDVPTKIVYTVKRTLQPIIVDDISKTTTWEADSYIVKHLPKSMLCMPIVNQGKLISILYLENNLLTGVFTKERIEILNLLCTQAAISLANAQLYQQTQQALNELQQTQIKLVQSEKMSALGNLVAGVAHEINNPIAFLAGNVQPALDYIKDIFGLLNLYHEEYPNLSTVIQEEIANIDLEYIREDLPKVIGSMREGINRIKNISNSLRTFSRADKDYKVPFNIHNGIDSTILILKHRLKANEQHPAIEVVTKYGNLPPIECFPGQLNQVFMNILANAIDALEEASIGRTYTEIQKKPNLIIITTAIENQHLTITIKDNGRGMSEAVKKRIFDHLFTTKGVGKGTGLGLAIAHQIIVEKHGGSIDCNSSLGEGTEFIITLPLQ
ncbi:trifunctional serine/threonine-protein kinase/ATP-binding protein/sensor histidine kinase [Nostoc sp. UHCC 0870]|uniref:trifunctional serine/threonine-protein kinase/ATP-binding protein/sensor histidine kinase n=1 Tax=Nostoc sp. UHCC 0870 TaxID=2914041 RepID=UPI001EDC9A9D|nr:ATP-binding sensor histidine kinase [Nostoc sp. UHCC 0870]UKO95779.1 trifunctional serine/threonine-protein kinase/ATP-binding protein/sensor histidine kinase [Nostoc sp. UHCC 0870]